MPWKEGSVMEERPRFVVRPLDGEPMTDPCLELGISRKTGDKIFGRHKERACLGYCRRSPLTTGSIRCRTRQCHHREVPSMA